MKMFHGRRQLAVFLMLGFLIGIVFVSFISKKYVSEPGIFSECFLEQLKDVQLNVKEYFWYLLKLRILPIGILVFAGTTKMRRFCVSIFLIWTGISAGILVTSAIIALGIKGCFLCIAGVLPHIIFYIPAYYVILWYCYSAPQSVWNRQKTCFVVPALTLAFLTELFFNPILMKLFLLTFC